MLLKPHAFSNGEKISSLFDELFLIEYELKKIAVQMRMLFFGRYLGMSFK